MNDCVKSIRIIMVLLMYYVSCASWAQAQDRVSGLITDLSGEPLIGVSILVKGTENGTVTDFDGKFTLAVHTGDLLRISYVGYISQEIKVISGKPLRIMMEEDAKKLDEVVVVGYGTQKKVSVTGSVVATSGKDLVKVPTVSITNSLTGRLPGLIATNRSGEPGQDDSELLIRGRSTTGNASPLVVVDGVADRAGGFSRIDPNDIESVTVLKDASAAIYGSRAANGVILVTTKKGKEGKISVNYTANVGFSTPTTMPDMCESWQYAQLQNEIETLIYGRTPKWTADQIQQFKDGSNPDTYPNINAVDLMLKKTAIQTQHNVSLSGGNQLIKYFASLGYQYQNNMFKNSASNYSQYNLRSNIDVTPHKNLKVTVNIAARQEDRNAPVVNMGELWRDLIRHDPMVNLYWPGTNYPTVASDSYFCPVSTDDRMGYQKRKNSYFNADLLVHLDMPFILKGLSFDGGIYVDRSDYFYKNFSKAYELYDKVNSEYVVKKFGPSNADLSEEMNESLGLTLNARFNYEKTIADHHNVKAFVAYEQYTYRYDKLYGKRMNFVTSNIDQMFAGDQKSQTNDGTASESARVNFFGRLDYDYDSKYLFQFNWRYDGSENFPKGKRFGFFPGVSLGWRISEESFWKDKISAVDYLKLRASWGQMGNDRVNPFQYMTTYTYANPGILGGTSPKPMTGIWQSRTPNPNITWEVATTYNIGLEARFLKYFNFELDVFKTDRNNILATRNTSIPDYAGLDLPDENIGKCSSWGTELSLGYAQTFGDFKLNLGGNITYADSEIKFIDEAPGTTEWQKRTGKAIDSNWLMYEAVGIFRTQADLDNNPHLGNAALGDLMFRDVDDNKIIDGNDKVRLNKSATPKIIYGINLGLGYKQWSLSTLWQGAAKVWQYTFFESGNIGNFTKEFYDNRWTEQRIDAPYPKVYDRLATVTGQKNTFWVRNSNYLRLKNIELAYTLPKNLLQGSFISDLRIYLSGYNLLTFTPIKNVDPEVAENWEGFSAWTNPQSKVINFGVNLTF